MLMAYASVAAFFLVAIVFILGSLLFGKLLRPDNLYAEKLETYECGEAPVGPAWFNFNPRFYIIALIYIVFDVEIAFVYPVATVFKRWVDQGSGVFAMIEIFAFVAILLFFGPPLTSKRRSFCMASEPTKRLPFHSGNRSPV